jgi:probable addiction module antidote protein
MMPIETTPWDPAERLTTPEAAFAYLEAAFEDGSPGIIAAALGDIARARGMAQVAREAGLSRDALYKALRPEGNPTLETLAGITRALGFKLTVERVDNEDRALLASAGQ